MKIVKILKIIKELDRAYTSSIFGQYSSSHVWRKINEMEMRRAGWKSKEEKEEIVAEEKQREQERFYNLLSYLQRQGFISKYNKHDRRENRWRLTKNGREKLKVFEINTKKTGGNLKPIKLKKSPVEDHLKIVVFDIPERKRAYRSWIRQTLRNCNYRMLQQSVWIGKVKLPKEFIQSLKRYGFLKCVHIFSVANRGTLHS